MFLSSLRYLTILLILLPCSNAALAISGKEISNKISNWLSLNNVSGVPIFSSNRIYKDCEGDIELTKYFNSYKTVKVSCINNDDFQLFVRIKLDEEVEAKQELKLKKIDNQNNYKKKIRLSNKENTIKKIHKVFKLNRGLEKNSILEGKDIKVIFSSIPSQKSFYKNKEELIGRKLNKNLRMDQILHPRHLDEKFEVNDGDQVSIVSDTGQVSVTVLGEALNSGNLDDLIKVKNVRSGKIIKGYIKKNKIIRVFR